MTLFTIHQMTHKRHQHQETIWTQTDAVFLYVTSILAIYDFFYLIYLATTLEYPIKADRLTNGLCHFDDKLWILKKDSSFPAKYAPTSRELADRDFMEELPQKVADNSAIHRQKIPPNHIINKKKFQAHIEFLEDGIIPDTMFNTTPRWYNLLYVMRYMIFILIVVSLQTQACLQIFLIFMVEIMVAFFIIYGVTKYNFFKTKLYTAYSIIVEITIIIYIITCFLIS